MWAVSPVDTSVYAHAGIVNKKNPFAAICLRKRFGWDTVRNVAHRKNPAAVALGRLGGKKGGKARAAALTAEERIESASRAAKARMDSLTPEERKKLGRKAAAARWKGHEKPKGKGG
jgi:hypothetical protein